MYFLWKKVSRLRNVLIAIIVFCLVYTAYSQKTRTTAKEDNPMYIQNFVSRMMSKHPLSEMNKPRDADGIEPQPNLGYEPYWRDEIDRTWELKCQRCPELFKRYTSVCAVDSTGDMTLNISMCQMMRMNCLSGYANGNTTDWSNDDIQNYYVVSNEWARVAVDQEFDLNIVLSSHPDKNHDYYVITLDGWKGSLWSGFFKNGVNLKWYYAPSLYDRALQYRPKWSEFVMRWNYSSGWFLITRRDYPDWTKGFHFNITDPDPFPIKYISLSGNGGQRGRYLVTGFMMIQTTPCANGPVAKPLVTSPTSAPEIYAGHSPINIGYFSRINESGLDLGNVSFLTREEY